jgi:hypothetical protein
MSLIRQRYLTVQHHTYSEYVGAGDPLDLNPPQTPGDVYINIELPYRVLYWDGELWKQWVSMSTSMDHPHPTLIPTRILSPTTKQFSWLPSSGYNGYLNMLSKRLGDSRPDNAITHVTAFAATHSLTKDSPRLVQTPRPTQHPLPQPTRINKNIPSSSSSTKDSPRLVQIPRPTQHPLPQPTRVNKNIPSSSSSTAITNVHKRKISSEEQERRVTKRLEQRLTLKSTEVAGGEHINH